MCWRDEVPLVRECSTCRQIYYGDLGHRNCPGRKPEAPKVQPVKEPESYIRFVHAPPAKGRKTSTWAVMTAAGAKIGEIRWFTRWRKYAFFPDGIFEEDCLREIASFIEARTKEHREIAKAPF